jgi:hypothetical protein
MANSALLCVLVKLLQPLQSKLVICPAIVRDVGNPVARYTQLLVSSREVVLALEDKRGWNRLPYCVDACNDTGPFSVTLLHCLWSAATLRAYDDSSYRYDAHHEARLIEVVRVFIQDAILGFGILYQAEPALGYLRILAEGSFLVVLSIKLHSRR